VRRLVLVVLLAMGVCANEAQAQDRYSLVGGCYALRSAATGKFVAKTADGGYRATAGGAGAGEPFRMQATDLGRYLLYGAKRDFLGVGKPIPLPVPSPTSPIPVPDLPVATTTQTGDRVQSAASPSETADWRVSQAGGDFVIDLPAVRGQVLTVAGDGTVIMRDRAAAGTRGRWAFVPRGGCPAYPEVYPDWVEDVRHIAGQAIVDDLGRGAEAYLQMWERADGIRTGCRPAKAKATKRGLAGARLGASPSSLLKRAGQPKVRGARRWTYCVKGGRMAAALTRSERVSLVGSTARGHKARGVRPGKQIKKGRTIRRRGRFVYVVRHRRVTAVAVTKAKSRKVIRRRLKTAGLL
jgi:hypothetical protein